MKHLIIFSSLLFALFLNAQNNNKISGKLLDENKIALNKILVVLLKTDKSIAKTTFSQENGFFEFDNLSKDDYYISISDSNFIEHLTEKIIFTDESLILLPIILKNLETNQLNEVKVAVKTQFVVQKADRVVVNPEALISNAGGNALEALSKSPGVMVGDNGEIKLKGKSGVTIFIDDKPTYLTGSELENYLKSLPTSSIKQIEIMTNPPAHYEAAGNSGIINIKTKRSALKGLNGSASESFGQGRYARTNENLNLNFNTSRLALFSNISYSNTNTFHDLTINRYFKNADLSPKSGFEQNTYLKVNAASFNMLFGLDYYISEKSTIGFSYKGLVNKQEHPRFNFAKVTNSDGSLDKNVIADNVEKL